MTYCPECGTANRDGSRFCNQCGELLGTEMQVKCAECGTLNPGQNLLCTECGARLDPPSDSEPRPEEPSLPTKADAETDDDESPLSPAEPKEGMPAWLRDLGATVTPEDRPGPDSAEEPTEIPAWLRDLRASMPTDSAAGLEQAETDKAAEPLAEPPVSLEDRKAPPPTPEIAEPEDWLTDSEEAAAPIHEDDEEPDWLAELRFAAKDREFSETPMALDADEEETPEWLARLRPKDEDIPQARTRPAQEAAPGTDDEPEFDWLEMGPTSEVEEDLEPELPAFDAEYDDSLDWMAELIPPPDEVGARTRKATPELDEEPTLDWLAEVDDLPQEARKKAKRTPSEADSADESDWLTEVRASDVEEMFEREAPISESEQVPDWLAESQTSIPEGKPEAEPEIEEELPTWDAAAAERADTFDRLQVPAAEAEFTEPSDAEDLEEFPFQDFPFPPTSIEGEEEFELAEKAGEDAELSEWLAELRPPISELEPEPAAPAIADEGEEGADQLAELAESTEPGTASATTEDELLEAEVPEWLTELQIEGPEEAEAELEIGAVEIDTAEGIGPLEFGEEDGLERADIPAWLMALKPPELRKEGEPVEPPPRLEGIDRDTGLLSGLQGTLPVEMIIAQPRAVTASRVVEAAITETDHTRLFGNIVGRTPEAGPRQIVRAPTWQPKMLPRWILYLALIVVVSLPLLLREPLVIRTIEPAPAITDLYNVIEALDNEAAVLVAFDYDPTTSGEMDVIGQALVGHLMDNGTKVIAMSLLPAGPPTAQLLLDGLAAEREDYADSYGQRYVNLGYLPGQAMAVRLVGLSPVRAFASDFQGTPLTELTVMDGLTSAEDFDLILDLAARQESVRWWVEQASMPYGIPLGAGVSAPVAPLAQPYYETDPRQLVGLIGGTPGAVTYEALQSSQGSSAQPAVTRLDSQMAGQLLLVLVLLVGNGIFLVQRGARR